MRELSFHWGRFEIAMLCYPLDREGDPPRDVWQGLSTQTLFQIKKKSAISIISFVPGL